MSYDPSNRREVIYGSKRARWLQRVTLIVLVQAALFALWAVFLVVKFRDNDTTGAVHLRTYFLMFMLPVLLAQVVVCTLVLKFLVRRNPTVRLLATFAGGLAVFQATLLRGLPGIVLTGVGLALAVLALWPDHGADDDSPAEPEQAPDPASDDPAPDDPASDDRAPSA
ncbi:MAG: hypothetical protein WAW88_13585 [Nocardioides sp.]